MPGENAHYRFYLRLCGSRSHHRPPQADICGGETSSPPGCFARVPDERLDLGRIFFMIFSLTRRRGLVDFRRFCHPQPHWRDIRRLLIRSWHPFESRFTLALDDRWERWVKSARSASEAENQFLIPLPGAKIQLTTCDRHMFYPLSSSSLCITPW